jgi:hypothetical protein
MRLGSDPGLTPESRESFLICRTTYASGVRPWTIGVVAVAPGCRRGVVNLAAMGRRRTLTGKAAQRLGERERDIGLDPDDEAAQWLKEHDPPPEPRTPKAATKSKVLHRWRQRQQRG